jgi:multiple sugar transport system ATP-binding protein
MDLFNYPKNLFVASFMGSPPMNQIDAEIDVVDGKLFGVFGDHRLALKDSKELGVHCQGHKVVLGIRPEHILTQAADETNSIPVELDLIETLGSEALLHTMVMDKPFVVKAETHGDIKHLEDINAFHFNAEMITVFDKESGDAFDHPDKA